MGFRVLTGLDFDTDFLPRVMEVDAEVYDQQYVGELENMVARYNENRDSFICVMDEEQDRLAGYINFFPCTDALYKDIRDETTVIRDDDIRPDEIAQYSEEGNHLFILSIAVRADYRGGEVIKQLSDAWISHLNHIQEEGYPIIDISAIAVSGDGQKALRNYMFTMRRKLEDGNIVYLCEGKFLEKLLAHELYFKSYRSDVYLLLPLADNVRNHRMDELFSRKEDVPERAHGLKDEKIPECARVLKEELQYCLHYEMSNAVLEELDLLYLGVFNFLHTTDAAYQQPEGEETVIGEEKAYAFLAAHRPSHMYVLTLFFMDSPFSVTQIQDQLAHEYLRIRDPKSGSKPRYVDFYEYIRSNYGLLRCGSGKSLLCLSGKPKDKQEFRNIMAGEAYNSMEIDYHIRSRELDEMCETDHAQYDYYEVYLSDATIAFILPDSFPEELREAPDDAAEEKQLDSFSRERIERTATYAFIAQLVMFQNTALAKTNIKITNALANNGDISYEQIYELHREFGKTVRFWEIRNFKYTGTQAEAACITKAFSNEALKTTYYEHQQFLEHIVELKTAQREAINGMVLNVAATILAVIQVEDFVVGLLSRFYTYLGIEAVYAQKTFTTLIFSGTITFMLIYLILKKKRRSQSRHNMLRGRSQY